MPDMTIDRDRLRQLQARRAALRSQLAGLQRTAVEIEMQLRPALVQRERMLQRQQEWQALRRAPNGVRFAIEAEAWNSALNDTGEAATRELNAEIAGLQAELDQLNAERQAIQTRLGPLDVLVQRCEAYAGVGYVTRTAIGLPGTEAMPQEVQA